MNNKRYEAISRLSSGMAMWTHIEVHNHGVETRFPTASIWVKRGGGVELAVMIAATEDGRLMVLHSGNDPMDNSTCLDHLRRFYIS